MVFLVRRAAHRGDVKAAQWWLERKFPDRWGRRDRHELSGPASGPIEVKSRPSLPPSKLDAILTVLVDVGALDLEEAARSRGLPSTEPD